MVFDRAKSVKNVHTKFGFDISTLALLVDCQRRGTGASIWVSQFDYCIAFDTSARIDTSTLGVYQAA